LYQTIANDFVYEDPMQNIIFLDNHDMTRFFSAVNEDVDKLKMALAWLLTCRGIPQMYYGTEVLMKGISNPDGWVRLDFPGGWSGDKSDKFTQQSRTQKENDVYEWTKKLANFRKNSTAIGKGKFMHFAPEDGVYVYFRYDTTQTVMCIMNTNDKTVHLNLKRFEDRLKGFTTGSEITTGTTLPLSDTLSINKRYTMVLELMK
jgi:glycosidase